MASGPGADGVFSAGAGKPADADDGVIFILENAPLETAKVGKGYAILNHDDHKNFLRKHKRDPTEYRPDILHQALLAIMDSPLNKAGKVKAVYVSTRSNVLFEVNTKTKLPRTYKRFAGLMVQLLQKLSIRATDGPDKLLRVIKQPVSRHLPAGCRLVGMSHRAGAAQSIYKRAPSIAQKGKPPCAFVVGAFAHGAPDASICVDASYVDEWVSISQYSLSAACVLARICNAMELQWAIL